MRIPVYICKTNKNFFVLVQPKNAYQFEFVDHLRLTFLDKLQSDILVLAIITFRVYNIMVKKWKHGIGPNDILSFNEELDLLSTSIIELVNIDES